MIEVNMNKRQHKDIRSFFGAKKRDTRPMDDRETEGSAVELLSETPDCQRRGSDGLQITPVDVSPLWIAVPP
ncbi:hypothetical protein GJAV_G00274680 [Gymnothorax javanicus]|nr:hypothetical protein GJAV_G00274680 [Gymnothorax javanicus]